MADTSTATAATATATAMRMAVLAATLSASAASAAGALDLEAEACTYVPAAAPDFGVAAFTAWLSSHARGGPSGRAASTSPCASLAVQPGRYYIENTTAGVRAGQDVDVWASLRETLASKHGYEDGDLHVGRGSGVHLPLTMPLADTTLSFTGVALVMGERSSTAVLVSGWTNATLRGLTVEYAEHPTNQAVITGFPEGQGGSAVDVRVPAGYPTGDWDGGKTFSCNVYVARTRFLRVGAGDM